MEFTKDIRDQKSFKIFGRFEENLPFLEKTFNVKIVHRGEIIKISGDKENVENAYKKLKDILKMVDDYDFISIQDLRIFMNGNIEKEDEIFLPKKTIKPKTPMQKFYLESIKKNIITFAIGPAGTGKTYLAVASALKELLSKRFSRIILTRPAVEAGESLGFLPGSFIEKVDPYLRPLYDALFDMLPNERVGKYIETGVIEIAPLAFMRGRTLNDAFIILDEAQNTTHTQLKMLLTRLGENSKAVVTGDITQIDLPSTVISGLVEVQKILKGLEGVQFVYLTNEDVVRNEYVRKIVESYENYEKNK
uniref:PhoH-like protein n=1 Tax=candidate division WOR-3 bacterium TaxID=2052148 RepID=A0A7C4Y571_UNCW3